MTTGPKPKTPAANQSANTPKINPKFILPVSGLEVEETGFKGRDIREAQRLINGDQTLAQFAIISVACKIDGKRITIEEIDEMDGVDVMTLIAKFEKLFS